MIYRLPVLAHPNEVRRNSLKFALEHILYGEEPRLREQEWGHLRSLDRTKMLAEERDAFVHFIIIC